ncbi:alpha-ketoglutarate-dependent taurine dioxygenase [Azorhizobium sp. AG788]|uniref:TauD/TfdA family dioxygenase n=1 Tax=Azorhizobium sp. AG788 TaxID=2183897 RepID=UPI00105F9BFD|nr:TauD/TfdA family dioxygenase [Azorhizobium sp. AG788]TDT92497.1 alpha-ketoglutarate-dependent taurine dioxygenase [Azorhizobium sp. AG788]
MTTPNLRAAKRPFDRMRQRENIIAEFVATSSMWRHSCLSLTQILRCEDLDQTGANFAPMIGDIFKRHLPEAAEALQRAVRGELGAVLLRQVFEPDPGLPTPVDDVTPPTNEWLAPIFPLLGMAGAAGLTPAAYYNEAGKHLFSHVRPTNASQMTRERSTSMCRMHTEVPHGAVAGEHRVVCQPIAPKGLMLAALKNPDLVKTTIISPQGVLSALPDWARDNLSRPIFNAPAPKSFGDRIAIGGISVLSRDALGNDIIRFSSRYESRDPVAMAAFKLLREQLRDEENFHRVTLHPGDAIFIANDRVLHGRESIVPRFDGNDRWIVRLYGFSSAALIEPLPAGPSAMFLGKGTK